MNIKNEIDNISIWLKEKVLEAGAKGVVFGLSGGIDSAVLAGIAKKTFPETSLGIIMPCHSLDRDEEDARLIADRLNLNITKVDLTHTFDRLIEDIDFEDTNKLAISNIKPRLRMTTLYFYGQSKNYLVVGPTNKSEMVTGYYTKHGDSGVDLLPLANYVKKDIWNMAKELNIPKSIIEKKPSAGLWENQDDEKEMGFSYDILDRYIQTGQINDKNIKEKIDNMYLNSKHKRSFPPIYDIID